MKYVLMLVWAISGNEYGAIPLSEFPGDLAGQDVCWHVMPLVAMDHGREYSRKYKMWFLTCQRDIEV